MKDLDKTDNERDSEFVSLRSGGQSYCIPIKAVREIRRWQAVTTLPNSDSATLGVMNLRGAVIPIIDLTARMGMPNSTIGERSVVVVIAVRNRVIGILVDVVSEILTIDEAHIQPNPSRNRDDNGDHIVGLFTLGDQMLKVLCVDSLLDETAEEIA